MRRFDWLPLFQRHGVFYIERGANVKRGEVNIRCPWCGNADPSQHLGVNLETGWYSCWRQKTGHSGKSPVRLIMILLRVSYRAARELAGLSEDYVDPEGFDALAARLLFPPDEGPSANAERLHLEIDRRFVPITETSVRTRRWWNYLYGRGFDADDVEDLCATYGLLAARDGRYADRLIIPYFLDGALVAWTARAIGRSEIRYLDLSIAESLVPIKQTLYNHDAAAKGGEALVIVEGPMDALKVDYYGQTAGVRCVALSTNSLTDAQAYMLQELAEGFPRRIVLMDNKTDYGLADGMRLRQELAFIRGLDVLPVPYGAGDPGELKPTQVVDWAASITKTKRS